MIPGACERGTGSPVKGPVRVPERRCISCGRRGPQSRFLRLHLEPDGERPHVAVDEGRHRSGRGAYLCLSRACLDKALRKRALNRAFRRTVSVDAEALLGAMEGRLHKGKGTRAGD